VDKSVRELWFHGIASGPQRDFGMGVPLSVERCVELAGSHPHGEVYLYDRVVAERLGTPVVGFVFQGGKYLYHGLGGVAESQELEHLALRQRGKFDAGFWVRMLGDWLKGD
jgi:hypothetical protein